MSQMLCLANSRRDGGRCIAGIELASGRLIRPVSKTESQVIPEEWTALEGKPVRPLDVVEIPFLQGDAATPFQGENRFCEQGWKRAGTRDVSELGRFCESDECLLHTQDSQAIPERFFKLKRMPRSTWKSLQLVRARDVEFHERESGKWNAKFRTRDRREYDLRATDDKFLRQMAASKDRRLSHCMLLLSLSRPWRHYKAPRSEPRKCYKLVAGVMPL